MWLTGFFKYDIAIVVFYSLLQDLKILSQNESTVD